MKNCPVHNSIAKNSLHFQSTARDEKLAFVERVCGALIESRFHAGYAAPWDMELCSSGARNSIEEFAGIEHVCFSDDIFTLDDSDSARHWILPSTRLEYTDSANGLGVLFNEPVEGVTNRSARDPRRFATSSQLARGSPPGVHHMSFKASPANERRRASKPVERRVASNRRIIFRAIRVA
ncbi:MAG: hypothetical protein QM785_17340 [Pyrinomonadaceae bacterium]